VLDRVHVIPDQNRQPTSELPSEPLLAALLDHAAPMLALDASGACRFANAAAAALTAEPDRPIRGERPAARLPILADHQVARLISGARAGRGGVVEATVPGGPRRFTVRAVPAGELVLLYLDETTALRAAESAAEDAAEQARLASLAGVTGTFWIDLVNETVWVSDSVRQIYGFEAVPDSLYPRSVIRAAVHADDKAAQAAAVAGAVANPGAVYDVTYRIVRGDDGAVRTLHAVGEVRRDPEGRPRTLLASVSDVTDRSATEEALRESEERLRQTVEGVDAIIAFREDGGSEVIQSPQIQRILGYRPEELTDNLAWDDLVHPDDLDTCVRAWRGLESEWSLTYRMRHADGRWIWVEDRGRWLDREEGRGRGLIGVVTDITDRMRVEADLRASEEWRRQTVEGIDAVLTYRASGEVLSIHSPQAERILGFTPDELAEDEAWWARVHPDDLPACLEAWNDDRLDWSLTYRFERKDGAWIWLDDRGHRFPNGDGGSPGLFAVAVDITERKRVEQALAESEERLRRTVEGVDAVITYLERNGAPTIQSPQVERILGYPPEALTTEEAWFDLVHPEDIERCHAAWTRRTPTWVLTYRMRRADGRWIWVDDRGQRFDTDDERSGYVGVVTDATDRVEAGHERRLADERRRRFFDANIVGTLVEEAGGRVLEANDYWLRLVGRTRDELERGELDWRAMTAPESLQIDDDAIAQLRQDGTALPYEKVYVRPDGGLVAALVVRASMPGPGEQIATFALDLTERNAAAAEMAELAAAIEQTSESVVVTDIDAVIRYVNPAFERTSGYTRAEALGQNPRILHSGVHGPEFFRDVWAALSQGETWNGELVNRRKDGTIYTEVAAISPIRDSGGRVTAYVGVKRDVTAERELEARLSQAQRLEAIGQLAGGIAHDFNNLLAVIRGYADLARAAMPVAGPATEDLDQVVLAADRASSLTRQLLLFSRRQAMEPRVVDPAAVIDGLAPMLRRLLGEHIDLEVAVAQPSAGSVRVDPGQLEQVVINLAANARDAMPEGGRLVIRTEPHDEDGAGWVRLSVEDTGMGMDETTVAHLFEPFFTTKAVGRGTGLGLSTVYGIVVQSGGRVNVTSVPGQGSTFAVDLPRVDVPAAATGDEAAAAPSSARRGLSVLLVEDDAAVRSLTRRMLASLGHAVTAASSGAEALGLVEVADRLPDVLITDVRMPGIQGQELARRLRDRRPDLPVVFISGFSAELGDRVAITGAQVLDKPFDLRRLEAAINTAIGPEA
jgi:PAS domain S-box-containing protein